MKSLVDPTDILDILNISRFFKQFLAFVGIHQTALSLFRMIAALGRIEVVANTLGSFTLLLVFVLGGYIVSKSNKSFSSSFICFLVMHTNLN